MQLGLVVTGVPSTRGSTATILREIVDLAHAARDSGFTHFVAGQHYLGAPYVYFPAVPLLVRLIPETGTMRLVTGVMLLPMLAPVEVADELAALDVLSDGRLIAGFGLGYRDEEIEGFGITRDSRRDRFIEYLEAIRRLWSGQAVNLDGQYVKIHAAGTSLQPLQRPEPPIWMAAMSPVTRRRAARLHCTPYLGPNIPHRDVAEWVRAYRRECGDPSARVPLRRELFLDPSRERAWEGAVRHLGERYEMYRTWGLEGADQAAQADFPAFLRERAIIGDPAECAEAISRYADSGVSVLVVRCLWPSLGSAEAIRMVELTGQAAARAGAI